MTRIPVNRELLTSEPDRRRSLRLQGYDYAQAGAYFVTICTQGRECLFGEIVGGAIQLNNAGRVVSDEWFKTAQIRENVILSADEFVVMPNHVHGIIWLVDGRGTLQRAPTVERFGKPTSGSIPTIVRLFKSVTTRQINLQRGTPGAPVWQRNYYEHIIRNDESLGRIRDYIVNNPLQWALDRENPANAGARGNAVPGSQAGASSHAGAGGNLGPGSNAGPGSNVGARGNVPRPTASHQDAEEEI